MKKIISRLLLFLFLFFADQSILAQEESPVVPLKEILANLSKQYKIQFNFLEDEVKYVSVTRPSSELDLSEKLKYLSNQTGLTFEIINSRYVVITSQKAIAGIHDSIKGLPILLKETVIEKYLASGISKTVEGNLIIKPKKFGILPGLTEADVLQTMQQVPGIYSADETVSNINVRSGTHDQNLFLWNGIRMFQTGHFFGLISAFNPSLSQKITISKNGTSAFYGESVSSVIDISSFPEHIENTASSISSNLIGAQFNSKIKISDNSSFQVSGRRSFTDWANSPTYQKYYNRVFQNTIVTNIENSEISNYHTDEKFYFYDFSAQYQHKISSRTKATAAFIGINNSLDLDQKMTSEGILRTRNSNLSQQNFGGAVSLKTAWNDNNFSKISGYVSYYNLNSRNEAVENNQTLVQQNTVTDMGFRLENSHLLNSDIILNTGYQYNEIGVRNFENIDNPGFSRSIKEVLRSHSLISEAEMYYLDGNLFIKPGLRFNYIEELEKYIFEPRLQFNYKLNQEISVEVLGEQKSQTASQVIDQQQDFLGLEKRRWILADDRSIPIQKSRQVSIGFTYNTSEWLISLDNFYKKVTGIMTGSQAFQNQLEFIKINGNYTVLGSELLVQKNFDRFYSWISYNLSSSEYYFDSFIPSQFTNNFQIIHSINWAGIYDWNNLKIALGTKWHSGRPETTPATNLLDLSNPAKPEIHYNFPNNKNLSDYFQVNFSASYCWNWSPKNQLELGISVLNVLNKKNTISRYYRVNNSNNAVESVNTYSLERTPNIAVKFNF
ncbi:hypothetical protein ABH942_001050 [Flavobacterium sp. 28YEA47A]|uniref:TonB-dependent receptor plug domain-containing protein n=1 Tax=Flavobacterium sp. 28YEA47A TaxID=3156276 RepID=UPI00351811AB